MNEMGLNFTQMTVFGTVAASVGTLLVMRRWGVALDRSGGRTVMMVAALAASLCNVFYLFSTPGNVWPVLLRNLIGAACWCGSNLAANSLQLSLAPEKTKASYIAFFSCFTCLVGTALGSMAGGALLDVGVYTLNFASMVMGNQIRRIVASCVEYESGVDAKDNIFIEYENGGMASLYASMTDRSNRTGCISGPKGYIEVSNINNPQEIRVYDQDGYGSRLIRTLPVPEQINGYEYEVRAALAAIEAGQVECPQMPHEETLEIMRQMDECRRQFGLVFPCEMEC